MFRVDRSTGAYLGTVAPVKGVSLTTFMARTAGDGVPNYGMLTVSDPVGFFDHQAQRFVLAWMSYAADSSTSTQEPAFWFAVTVSADPTANWIVKAIDANPASGTGADCATAAKDLVSRRAPGPALAGRTSSAPGPYLSRV
jgi:hypothetical protein